jgi:carboxyl-terminal processing protease
MAAMVAASAAVPRAQAPHAAAETFDVAWTTVRDKHFDKTLNGVDWNAVREELRPRAVAARSVAELRAVIRDMLGRLGQSHFALIPSSPDSATTRMGSADPGFDVQLVGGELLVTRVEPNGPAAAAGVSPGWRVTRIAEVAAADLLARVPEGIGERLKNVQAWQIVESWLRGGAGVPVRVGFEDGDGRPVTLSIDRRAETGVAVRVGNLPTMFVRVDSRPARTPGGRTAGVIAFNVWMAAVDAPFQRAVDQFRNSDGIVIDLRGNPGGLAAMLMGISGHFLDERKPLGIMKTRETELRFVANPRLVNAAGQPVQPFAGPVAILVDALSGSASECFTGGMQSIARARVFGQVSMGQALPALFQTLPNGDVMIHAYGDFVTADGTRLEGRGVIPDEVVPLRREDLLAGRDRPLEAALAWIDRERGASRPQHQ